MQKNPSIKNEPLFNAWKELNDRYLRLARDDCAYFYSERTNCGIIASAAYSAGFVAIEESPTRRRSRRGQGRGGRSGRYDIYIRTKNIDYLIEAKQSRQVKNADSKLKESETQIKKIHRCERLDTDIAIVFIVQGFKAEESCDIDILGHINKINDIKHHGAVHYYPKAARALHGGGNFQKYIYPGISIIMRVVD